MSRLSGSSGRKVEKITVDIHGKKYNVIVFGGWAGWEKYIDDYLNAGDLTGGVVPDLYPDKQWTWVQNYPDLVADDLSRIFTGKKKYSVDDVRKIVYSDLLYRGVNKWLAVRYFIIRYKKIVNNQRLYSEQGVAISRKVYNNTLNNLINLYNGNIPEHIKKIMKDSYNYGYVKGYYTAMSRVRSVLKALCNTPRFVIWNKDRPGVIIDSSISDNFVNIIRELYSTKFEK